MGFFKKLFKKEQPEQLKMIQDLKEIYAYIMPEIHPHDYRYQESLFKTAIKFRTPATFTEQEMRQKTRLATVKIVKKTHREIVWKAYYKEFIALYASPALAFAQNDLRKMIHQLEELEEAAFHYDSIAKFDETVTTVKEVLKDAKESEQGIEAEVLQRAVHILQHVTYGFELELYERSAEHKRILLDKLKIESELMEKQ
jgi:hypothetical protein